METFGMSLQEARAFGLPILALDAGHARAHFTHGENGFLFSTIDDLSTGLLELARDDRAAGALFERSQALALRSGSTWKAAAESLVDQLERALEGPRRTGR